MPILFFLALIVSIPAGQSKGGGPEQDVKIVTLREADGKLRLYKGARKEPFRDGMRPSSTHALSRTTPVRDSEGRVISAVGFYAWEEAGVVRLKAFKLVPAEGEPNEYLYGADVWSRLRAVELATYTTPLNKMIDLPELKPMGLGIVKARLELGVPKK